MKTFIKHLLTTGLIIITKMMTHGQDVSLSLEDALRIAKDSNRTLQIGRYDERQAEEQTRISKSYLLPQVNVAGNYAYYFDRQVIFMPGSFTGNENKPVVDVAVGGKNAISGLVTLQQPLISEASRKQIKVSRLHEEIQFVKTKEQEANLILQLSASYLHALLTQESIRLYNQSLLRNEKGLEDSRALLLQGKNLKVDTLRNFILVENMKTQLSYLKNQLEVSLLEIRQLTGISEDKRIILSDSLNINIEHFKSVQLYAADDISNRHDIRHLNLNKELSKNLWIQQRALRMPTLSLVGAYQVQAQADDRILDSYRWPKTSFLGLQANIPIFSGNRINYAIRHSSHQRRKSELQLLDATEKAKVEINILENNLKELLERIKTQEKTVYAAEMNYGIVADRYENGLSSRLELSDAELALSEAKMNKLQSVYQIKVAKLKLDNALGLLQY